MLCYITIPSWSDEKSSNTQEQIWQEEKRILGDSQNILLLNLSLVFHEGHIWVLKCLCSTLKKDVRVKSWSPPLLNGAVCYHPDRISKLPKAYRVNWWISKACLVKQGKERLLVFHAREKKGWEGISERDYSLVDSIQRRKRSRVLTMFFLVWSLYMCLPCSVLVHGVKDVCHVLKAAPGAAWNRIRYLFQ